MSSLDRPKTLRDLPPDGRDAVLVLLNRLGPLTQYELKKGLGRRFRKTTLNHLVSNESVIIVETEPEILYGLPEHRKLTIDKGNIF